MSPEQSAYHSSGMDLRPEHSDNRVSGMSCKPCDRSTPCRVGRHGRTDSQSESGHAQHARRVWFITRRSESIEHRRADRQSLGESGSMRVSIARKKRIWLRCCPPTWAKRSTAAPHGATRSWDLAHIGSVVTRSPIPGESLAYAAGRRPPERSPPCPFNVPSASWRDNRV